MKYKPEIVVKWFAEHGIFALAEHRFDPLRKWRFDFALCPDYPDDYTRLCRLTDHKLALECEGGIWQGGRHNRPTGFLKDMEKYNAAAVLGWRILRTTPQDLCTTETIEMIQRALDR